MMLQVLLRQRLCTTSWIDGRNVPMIFSAVLTTLYNDFFTVGNDWAVPNELLNAVERFDTFTGLHLTITTRESQTKL